MEICNTLNVSHNSTADTNPEYDEVIDYFLSNGLKVCQIRFYYQILLLYPMDGEVTAMQIVESLCNLRGIIKNSFSYLCASVVQYDTIAYCAVYMDWGINGYKRKHAFHYELNVNDEFLTPVMISMGDKGFSALRRLFSRIRNKLYMTNSAGNDVPFLHEEDKDIRLTSFEKGCRKL